MCIDYLDMLSKSQQHWGVFLQLSSQFCFMNMWVVKHTSCPQDPVQKLTLGSSWDLLSDRASVPGHSGTFKPVNSPGRFPQIETCWLKRPSSKNSCRCLEMNGLQFNLVPCTFSFLKGLVIFKNMIECQSTPCFWIALSHFRKCNSLE